MIKVDQSIRSEWLFWFLFYGIITASWVLLILIAVNNVSPTIAFIEAICASSGAVTDGELMGMWTLMLGAMMLPTFRAHVTVHQDIRRNDCYPSHSFMLVLGFLSVWMLFVPLGAFSQKAFFDLGFLDSSGRNASLAGNGIFLIVAGVYQFSELKRACMTRCASPMHYFFQNWRDHHIGALRMGLHLGLLCVGCCWALMALAFVGGTMNVLWMAMLTALMIFDKQQFFNEDRLNIVGWTLLGSGLLVLLIAIILEVIA